MRIKGDILDELFRAGFSNEEGRAREITEDEFLVFLDANKRGGGIFPAEWRRYALRLAATFLLFAGGGILGYRYFAEPEVFSGRTSLDKSSQANGSVLPFVSENSVQRKIPIRGNVGSELQHASEKTLISFSSYRNRPETRFIEGKADTASLPVFVVSVPVISDQLQDSLLPSKSEAGFIAEVVSEQNTEIEALDPSEIDSIEFRPGRKGNENSSLRATGRRIRNVDQAKVYLLQSLARWAGLIRPDTTGLQVSEM